MLVILLIVLLLIFALGGVGFPDGRNILWILAVVVLVVLLFSLAR